MNEKLNPSGSSNRWKSTAVSLLLLCSAGATIYLLQPKSEPVPHLDSPSFLDAARKANPTPYDPSSFASKSAVSGAETPNPVIKPADPTGHLRPSPWDKSVPSATPALIEGKGLSDLLHKLNELDAERMGASSAGGAPWREYDNFYGRIFPCLAIAQASQNENPETRPEGILGDYPNSPYITTVMSPHAGALLRLELRCDEMMKPSVVEARAPTAGPFGLIAKVHWDLEALEKNAQARQVELTWSLSIDGGPTETRTHSITLEPVNVVPLTYKIPSGETLLLFPIFAAFVNEDHPSLDGLLSEALSTQVVSVFTGMPERNNPDVVREQVLAIWWALQRRGIVYSNVSDPSTPSDEILAAQRVRLLDDIVDAKQANCIDGTVLLASLMRRIGLYPLICVKNGHAFLAFHTDNEGKPENVEFVETTYLNSRGAYLEAQAEIATRGEQPTEDPYTASRVPGTQTCPTSLRDARAMFKVAQDKAKDEARQAAEAAQQNKGFFYMIDVESMRRTRHIRPIPSLKH